MLERENLVNSLEEGKWKRLDATINPNNLGLIYAYAANHGDLHIKAAKCDSFTSEVLGKVTHYGCSFTSKEFGDIHESVKFAFDPGYAERVWVLTTLGNWKKAAIEVFPMQKDLVDTANIYHLWEFISEEKLPFDYERIFYPPDSLFESVGDCFVISNEIIGGRVFSYMFMKSRDGHELKWSEKQFFKNSFLGRNRYAVELITPKMLGKNYTCLIAFPVGTKLDFSL